MENLRSIFLDTLVGDKKSEFSEKKRVSTRNISYAALSHHKISFKYWKELIITINNLISRLPHSGVALSPVKSAKNGSFVSWWFPLIANHYLNKSFGVALFNLFNTLFRMQMEFNWNYDFSLVIQKWNANKSPIKIKCELLCFAFLSCLALILFSLSEEHFWMWARNVIRFFIMAAKWQLQ